MLVTRHAALQQRLLSRLATKHHLPLQRTPISLTYPHLRFQSTTSQQPPIHLSQPPPPRPKASAFRRVPVWILKNGFFAITFFLIGIYSGTKLLPSTSPIHSLLSPPTSDAETLTSYVPPDAVSEEINNHILQHPLAAALRKHNPGLREQRPHLKIPAALRATNLTGGTLAGPGKIVVPPLTFLDPEGRQLASLFYLGDNLCGHPGIIHGGLLATLLDEGLARCCFPAMPNKIAVTASLKVEYRRPVKAGEYYVLRAETTRVEGRKAWVRGWIERLEEGDEQGRGAGGEKLVEAEALFVEPRNAGVMKRIYNID